MAVALGIDVGERRIGVARSDAWGLLATPLTAVIRTSDRAALDAIARLIEESGAALLVVGVPYGEAGELTPQARRVTAFGHKLAALPGVDLIDGILVSNGLTGERAEPYRRQLQAALQGLAAA